MKEIWLKYKEWWANLASRERQMVVGGAIFLIIFIVYQGIWTPYLESVANLRKQIQTGQIMIEWMQATDNEIRQLETKTKGKQHSISPVVFLGQMQKEVNHIGLHDNLTQLKQSTNDSIEMHFQKVEFDKLMSLLISVVKEQSVSISQMSVTSDNTPGLVNADIILKM